MREGNKFNRVAVLGILMLLTISACGGSDSKGASPARQGEEGGGSSSPSAQSAEQPVPTGRVGTQAEAEPVRGGSLTVATYSEASTLDPARSPGAGTAGGMELNAVFDVLMRYDFQSGEYVPQLAKSLEHSDDYTEWTLQLRPGVEFTDGTALNADAVVFSFKRMVEMDARSASLIKSIDSMTTPDDHTVVFHLNEAWPGFPYILAGTPGHIVSPTAARESGKEEFGTNPVGAGPFILTRFAAGEELVLKANPNYWDGDPYIQKLRFISVDGAQATLSLVDNGQAQIAYIRNAKVIHEALGKDYPGFIFFQNAGKIQFINNRSGHPGANVTVRRAIAAALDPKLIDERATGGSGMPGSCLFQEASIWHTDAPCPKYDPDKARELLEEAKSQGYDGTLVYVAKAGPTSNRITQTATAMLEKVGFDVTLDNNNTVNDFIRKVYRDQKFDLAETGTSVGDASPYTGLYRYYHSESNQNLIGYRNPKMDSLLGELKSAPSRDAKLEVTADIQRLWTEDVPAVVTGASREFLLWTENVYGVVPTARDTILLGNAFLSK